MTWLLATGSDGIEGRWLSVDRPINTAHHVLETGRSRTRSHSLLGSSQNTAHFGGVVTQRPSTVVSESANVAHGRCFHSFSTVVLGVPIGVRWQQQ